MTCARCVQVCFERRGEQGEGDLKAPHQANTVSPGAPAGRLPSPPTGAGVALATPTPSSCSGPAGPSAAWSAPWRGRTRPGLLDDVAHKLRPQRMGPGAVHVGLLHGGGLQCSRPRLQNYRLPQLGANRRSPAPHITVKPHREPLSGGPPLMGLGRADPEVGHRF